ncbi:MAG: cupin domain-containing protein [Pseudomonadota bacterium]
MKKVSLRPDTLKAGDSDAGTQRLDPTPSFGGEVRQLRKVRGLTLKQLSAASGVSLSHLSAIERNATKPSLDVIEAVAAALSITPDWFFARRSGEGPRERAYVVREEERRNLNALYGQSAKELGYADRLLSSSIGGNFYMGIAHYAPGEPGSDESLISFEGEQHGVLIEGEVELRLDAEVLTLRAGDSYSLPASIPHRVINRSSKPAVLIWAVAPVVLPLEVTGNAAKERRGSNLEPRPNSEAPSRRGP